MGKKHKKNITQRKKSTQENCDSDSDVSHVVAVYAVIDEGRSLAEKVKLGTINNKGNLVLNNANYWVWKENVKSRIISLGFDLQNLFFNGYTKTPPSSQELQKNGQALNEIFCILPDSELDKIMHWKTTKEVWDNLQAIHEGEGNIVKEYGFSLGRPISNLTLETFNESRK